MVFLGTGIKRKDTNPMRGDSISTLYGQEDREGGALSRLTLHFD